MTSTAPHFFDRLLPLLSAAELARLYGSQGAIAFRVGTSAWTFRFASERPVSPGFDRDAELQLWFTEAAFLRFIDGTLDVAEAVRIGGVRARGDLSLLQRFGRFLQRGEAALGWEG